jgi:uncharacterized circularly permuted ATP-grasp superfamily protein/uncharacterized alpha-E superfamily protein
MPEIQLALSLEGALQGNEAGMRRLLAEYRPLPGVFDEMMDADRAIRPHWLALLSLLGSLGPDEIERRSAAANQYLRESGVFYRVHEDAAAGERPWPFSHVPLVMAGAEWARLKAGLIERAELMETLLGDTYGSAHLVRDGKLPAVLVTGNPEFLRPLVGLHPIGGYLRVYAVDVGRGKDGRWWVLGDRTQAPSGAGYAIENRLAMTRALPDIHRQLGIARLAPFFQALQGELAALNRHEESRVALLTPGPLNETYFEHAFLARYLGFLLVEGGDLMVRDDNVFVRTVSGPKRADVLIRRIDADFADPLELNARSRLGVPGLLQAVRAGKVAIANALGSGLLEARAMLSFLPAVAPSLIGRALAIPNIATWWLGQREALEEVIGRFDEMVVAPAFAGHLTGDGADQALGSRLAGRRRDAVLQAIQARGLDFVMQEAVTLSTMPSWQDGRLVPRPFVLRLFLTKVGDGWQVMPGGFVRQSDGVDASAVGLQQGGRTADMWVTSEGPVSQVTLIPAPDRVEVKRAAGILPSRAADNLFWLARYVERAENTLRLLRALMNRIAEATGDAVPIMAEMTALLGAWSAAPTDMPNARPILHVCAALQRPDLSGSMPHLAGNARAAAANIRERLSPDAWRALDDLVRVTQQVLPARPQESVLFERINTAMRILLSFSGLAQENMSQLAGWRFFELGRRIERAITVCRWLRCFGPDAPSRGGLEALLELCDSQITYRQRYLMVAAPAPVVDLVALDPSNPRSIAFQMDRIEGHLASLPRSTQERQLTPAQQIACTINASLRTADPEKVDRDLVGRVERDLMGLSDVVTASYLALAERSEDQWKALA